MKQLFTILALSAMAISAGARITVTKGTDYEQAIPKAKRHNTLSKATLCMKGNNVLFEGLPKNNLDYYIINAAGNVELQGKLSRKHNTLDIAKLQNGAHTIALKQGASIKVFGWLAEVVVKG